MHLCGFECLVTSITASTFGISRVITILLASVVIVYDYIECSHYTGDMLSSRFSMFTLVCNVQTFVQMR